MDVCPIIKIFLIKNSIMEEDKNAFQTDNRF